jgi:hypothetical protein
MGRKFLSLLLALFLGLTMLTGCTIPRVSAEQRLFLNLSLDFLGEYRLPKTTFKDTPVGGLSGITYDPQQNVFYAISDDRSEFAPARFYTLKLNLDTSKPEAIGIKTVEITNVTFLSDVNGETFPKGSVDLEGIALSPERSLFISSEGVTQDGVPPFIAEFDLQTGRPKQRLPLPKRYLPNEPKAEAEAEAEVKTEAEPRGVDNNLGFEALTLSAPSSMEIEPFRVFAATESALLQDKEPVNPEQGAKSRLLHYFVEDGRSLLIAEHLYPQDPPMTGTKVNGLTEILAIDQGGHFLGLERSFGATGFGAKLFQLATGGATDTSTIPSFKGELKGVERIRKQLLANLGTLDLPLDNLEAMTIGPRLPDGSQSLLVVSDDNFSNNQVTQFLLFRLKKS